MAKSLVIVESPAKVKTISQFLGKDYLVKSSVGHIRDLTSNPVKKKSPAKKQSLSESEKEALEYSKVAGRMGVDPLNGWDAVYEVLPGKEKVLSGLKQAADKVDTIFLATDIDREGEAIAWHLKESIGGDDERYQRITFTEITRPAISAAISAPSRLNMDRVNAQQARRFLDRVVGFMVSPLLWEKIARGLSAGRVQSVAVRLIAEREREIHAFKPDEYWEVHLDLQNADQSRFVAQVAKENGQAFRPTSESQTSSAVKEISETTPVISEIEKKPTRVKPLAPFITSTLQQAASVRLGYGVKKTMTLAQKLYEAGYITYMRTDSTNLSQESVEACRSYIKTQFGLKYLPDQPVVYKSKKSAQEAHEAIRPTEVGRQAESLGGDEGEQKLYRLIWQQFVACQMNPAEYDSTSVSIDCGKFQLRARGRVMTFPGFTKAMPAAAKKQDSERELPALVVGDHLTTLAVNPSQHFTKPPPRYSEASLVRELEKRGIGRPSTYASIISTIQERGYVRGEGRRFFCLKMGELVTDRLVENFSDLLDFNFTATMEEQLDKIANGELQWREVLDEFYGEFTVRLAKAKNEMRLNTPVPTEVKCPECSRPMNIRIARTGVFLSCSGYELPPKERCKGTLNLVAGDEAEQVTDEDESAAIELMERRRCQVCDTAMDHYLIDEQRKIHVCGNMPECSGVAVEHGKFRIKGYSGPVIECDKCNAEMQLKTGRFGKYFSCTADSCKNTRKLLKNGEPAPPRMDPIPMPELPCEKSDGHFILRDGAAGIFLASSKFPKSRETRKPRVDDLVRHSDKLDDKIRFILDAPVVDPEGNPTVVRFSRKTKTYFVGSDRKDGKPTNWTLIYVGGNWIEPSETKR